MCPFTFHQDLESYLAALQDQTRIPVLGDEPAGFRKVAELLAGDFTPAAAPVPNAVIVAPSGSVTGACAKALAERLGAASVVAPDLELDDIVAAYPDVSDIVLMALNDEVDIDDVVRAHHAIDRIRTADPACRTGLGVVTGQTAADISWLLAKGLSFGSRRPPENPHLFIDPMHTGAGTDHRLVKRILGRQAHSDTVRPLLYREHHGVVSFRTRGRDQAINLVDTVLCGGDPRHRPTASSHGTSAPLCAFTGECYREGATSDNMMWASEVRADVVFANACMTWRPGYGLVGPEYQLTNGFLRGPVAVYVGALHPAQGRAVWNELFHQAVAQGATVGAATAIVNDAVRRGRSDLPYFTLLGLPWLVVAGAPEGNTNRSPELREAILAAKGHDALVARITAGARSLGEMIDRLDELRLLGFSTPRLDRGMKGLLAQAASMARTLQRARSEGDGRQLVHRLATFRNAVEDVENSALEDLQHHGMARQSEFRDVWGGILSVDSVRPAGNCPVCGGAVSDVVSGHPVFGWLGRRIRMCNQCATGTDFPLDSLLVSLDVHTPALSGGSMKLTVDVSVVPSGALPEASHATGSVYSVGAAGKGISWQTPQGLTLTAGQATTFRATVEADSEVGSRRDVLHAVLMMGGVVYCASRTWVV